MLAPQPVREMITESVASTFGSRDDGLMSRFHAPLGDPGWFGPSSVAWRVHGDLGSMLVGGMSALMLRTLHPHVMQGVADHSNYRDDPFGRLRRTAEFLAATTYGSDELAREAVRHVHAMHRRVRGVTPDGMRYRASDPDLVAYVHVTEVWSFLRAYQRYSLRPLSLEDRNRYLREQAVVARRLGARTVPVSTVEARRYFRDIQPALRRTPAAESAIRFLRAPVGRSPFERAAHATIVEAAIDLLPAYARFELRLLRPPILRRAVVRPAAATLAVALQWSLGESPVRAAARQRVEAGTIPTGTPTRSQP